MADLITTLKKKGDASTDVYPNIKKENIPSGAITTDKLENGAITNAKLNSQAVTESKIGSGAVTSTKIQTGAVNNSKIADGAVTNDKIADGTITNAKIANGTITTEKIGDGSVTNDKIAFETITSDRLSVALQKLLANLTHTYSIKVANENEDIKLLLANTTLTYEADDYTHEDWTHALDFDYPQSDRTIQDLRIYKNIIDGIHLDTYLNQHIQVGCNDYVFELMYEISSQQYKINVFKNNNYVYQLWFDNSFNITQYLVTEYFYLQLTPLINTDVESIDIDE